ncbi:MAG TPA: 50S ribosomal protein L5 [Leptospiraceae bacterium]|nr:50S ribosomal protein L5 [Leptospiraceae bacterium]HMY66275.1 50S ribosomal protein L5 [Leptospiraceae bacterium]HMZ58330.1 50S ribosomal protein L5 [Leptospiraceae bacterium]HNF12823.1 50S ribosomal protein L5 [Leptospiraceae bacterium]HNF27520.1 50S ribosomal protein L5 [Leptospiraceae bacterium]
MSTVPRLKTKYLKEIKPSLVEKYKYSSTMEAPKLEKIVINVGMGDGHTNPKALESALETLGLITGQRAVKTKAKKSIAGFKLRENMNIGCMVTLRGNKMFEFLDRFINVALPRVRDFKGVNPKGFDGRGNYNMGIKEQIIFPEIQFDKVHSIHGMNIAFITSSKTNDEAFDLLKGFGMPYKK